MPSLNPLLSRGLVEAVDTADPDGCRVVSNLSNGEASWKLFFHSRSADANASISSLTERLRGSAAKIDNVAFKGGLHPLVVRGLVEELRCQRRLLFRLGSVLS